MVLTRALARSAEASARFAREAAEASRAAVAAAEAVVDVRFRLWANFGFGAATGEELFARLRESMLGPHPIDPNESLDLSLMLTCEGSTVHVHGAALVDVGRASGSSGLLVRGQPIPLRCKQSLPVRLHAGERIGFELEEQPEGAGRIALLRAKVEYSLYAEGERHDRTVMWTESGEEWIP